MSDFDSLVDQTRWSKDKHQHTIRVMKDVLSKHGATSYEQSIGRKELRDLMQEHKAGDTGLIDFIISKAHTISKSGIRRSKHLHNPGYVYWTESDAISVNMTWTIPLAQYKEFMQNIEIMLCHYPKLTVHQE